MIIRRLAALLCFSVVGLAAIHVAGAADANTLAPASGASGQYETSSNTSSAQTQSPSTIADPPSQTLTIPLVPFQLTVANQTVSGPTSSSAAATGSPTGEAPSAAPSADAASSNVAQPADIVTTNVTQPTADNGSLAPLPVSQGGAGGPIILLTALSSGAALVVLALMRYWSFSFEEGTESSPDFITKNVVYVWGSAYSTLESAEYGYIPKGP